MYGALAVLHSVNAWAMRHGPGMCREAGATPLMVHPLAEKRCIEELTFEFGVNVVQAASASSVNTNCIVDDLDFGGDNCSS